MALFPKLARGLDVNVRFDAVDGLEYSEDLLLFDVLHVRLLHGWLVDPQDRETACVVSKLSYNQLVEKVIEFQSPAHPPPPAPSAPTLSRSTVWPASPAAAQPSSRRYSAQL